MNFTIYFGSQLVTNSMDFISDLGSHNRVQDSMNSTIGDTQLRLKESASGRNASKQWESPELVVFAEKYYSFGLLVVGTIGNLLCLAVLSRKTYRRSNIGIYLRFLTLSDLTALYTGVLFFTARAVFGLNFRKVDELSCKFHRWMSFVGCDLSSWALVLLSSARLISIVWPMKRLVTRRRVYISLLTTVTLILAANLPIFIIYGNTTDVARNKTNLCVFTRDSYEDFYNYVFSWLVLLKFGFLPCVILIVLNTALVVNVYRSGKAIRKIQGPSSSLKASTNIKMSISKWKNRLLGGRPLQYTSEIGTAKSWPNSENEFNQDNLSHKKLTTESKASPWILSKLLIRLKEAQKSHKKGTFSFRDEGLDTGLSDFRKKDAGQGHPSICCSVCLYAGKHSLFSETPPDMNCNGNSIVSATGTGCHSPNLDLDQGDFMDISWPVFPDDDQSEPVRVDTTDETSLGSQKSDIQTDGQAQKSDIQADGQAQKSDIQAESHAQKSDIQADGQAQTSDIQAESQAQKSDIQADGQAQKSDIQAESQAQKSDIHADGQAQKSDIQAESQAQKSDIKADGHAQKSDMLTSTLKDNLHVRTDINPPTYPVSGDAEQKTDLATSCTHHGGNTGNLTESTSACVTEEALHTNPPIRQVTDSVLQLDNQFTCVTDTDTPTNYFIAPDTGAVTGDWLISGGESPDCDDHGQIVFINHIDCSGDDQIVCANDCSGGDQIVCANQRDCNNDVTNPSTIRSLDDVFNNNTSCVQQTMKAVTSAPGLSKLDVHNLERQVETFKDNGNCNGHGLSRPETIRKADTDFVTDQISPNNDNLKTRDSHISQRCIQFVNYADDIPLQPDFKLKPYMTFSGVNSSLPRDNISTNSGQRSSPVLNSGSRISMATLDMNVSGNETSCGLGESVKKIIKPKGNSGYNKRPQKSPGKGQESSNGQPASSTISRSKSLTKTLLVLNTVFLLSTTPITVYMTGKTYFWPNTSQNNSSQYSASQDIVATIANFSMYTNNAINFILYCVTGSKFRGQLILMFIELFHLLRNLARRLCKART